MSAILGGSICTLHKAWSLSVAEIDANRLRLAQAV